MNQGNPDEILYGDQWARDHIERLQRKYLNDLFWRDMDQLQAQVDKQQEAKWQTVRDEVQNEIQWQIAQARFDLRLRRGPIKMGIDHAKPGADRTATYNLWKDRLDVMKIASPLYSEVPAKDLRIGLVTAGAAWAPFLHQDLIGLPSKPRTVTLTISDAAFEQLRRGGDITWKVV